METAYIVGGFRTAVGKAKKGGFRFTRPDDLAARVIKKLLTDFPQLDPNRIDDLIVGNAVPEAEQGLQMGRMIALMCLPQKVAGMTVNRYCASGLETIAIATAKIQTGMADCIIAGGTESMSLVPTVGWKTIPNYTLAKENPDWYLGMGLTAEAVAEKYHISREEQDIFSFHSHQKAIKAIKMGSFQQEIVPVTVEEVYLDENEKREKREFIVDTDEGPRADTTLDALSKLKPVFANKGTVTAGNSSQTSDGAAFVLIMSEKMMKELNFQPLARLIGYGIAGVDPKLMGIGPVEAIPKALINSGKKINEIGLIEINEAFASQVLAIINELKLNPDVINVNGGAIALGHPLGCSGTKLSIQLINEARRRKEKYGIVSLCVGGGQGIAGVFEVYE